MPLQSFSSEGAGILRILKQALWVEKSVMERDQEYCAIFGELAMLFSNMEAMVALILESLIDPQNPLIGGVITTDIPLAKKIEHVRSLARLRFCADPETERRILELVQKVDDHRNQRNSFVHGLWVVNPQLLAEQRVICSDPRWRASRPAGQWTRMRDKDWTFDQIRSLSRETGQIVLALVRLAADVPGAITKTRAREISNEKTSQAAPEESQAEIGHASVERCIESLVAADAAPTENEDFGVPDHLAIRSREDLEVKLREGIESGPEAEMTDDEWASIRREVAKRIDGPMPAADESRMPTRPRKAR